MPPPVPSPQSDLLSLPIVQKLQHSDKHEPLFRLLSLLLTARYSDLTSFLSSNPSLLPSLAITEEDCTSKMRLLTLADMASDALAATHSTAADASSSAPSSAVGEIRYAAIQDALQVRGRGGAERRVLQTHTCVCA